MGEMGGGEIKYLMMVALLQLCAPPEACGEWLCERDGHHSKESAVEEEPE